MTPLSPSSPAPSDIATEVKVLKADPGAIRRRTFSSPFRKDRLAIAEVEPEREPDIMDELDSLLGGFDVEDDDDFGLDEEPTAPVKAPRKTSARCVAWALRK